MAKIKSQRNRFVEGLSCWKRNPKDTSVRWSYTLQKDSTPWPMTQCRRPCSLTPVVEVVLCQEHGLQCQVGTPCYVASCQL